MKNQQKSNPECLGTPRFARYGQDWLEQVAKWLWDKGTKAKRQGAIGKNPGSAPRPRATGKGREGGKPLPRDWDRRF